MVIRSWINKTDLHVFRIFFLFNIIAKNSRNDLYTMLITIKTYNFRVFWGLLSHILQYTHSTLLYFCSLLCIKCSNSPHPMVLESPK